MKDSKFIELLNLYVDHQISASDAALLESEIQKNPERRRVYRQYCQMQKACSVLAENFRTEAPVGNNVVAIETPRPRFAPFGYAIGALAAAACVAFVAVQRVGFNKSEGQIAQTPPAESIPVAVAQVTPATTPAVTTPAAQTRVPLQPAFGGLVRGTTPVRYATNDESSRPQFEWMNAVKLSRVPIEELRFDRTNTFQPQDLTFRGRSAAEAQTETLAFRFQK
jgi:anti-sigma factor RsiW